MSTVNSANDKQWQRNTPQARAERRANWETDLATRNNKPRDGERRWNGVRS